MTESKDRAALRALMEKIDAISARGSSFYVADLATAQETSRQVASARAALAQPDPAEELVEALGNLCLEAHHFADNRVGEQFLRASIERARAALAKVTP